MPWARTTPASMTDRIRLRSPSWSRSGSTRRPSSLGQSSRCTVALVIALFPLMCSWHRREPRDDLFDPGRQTTAPKDICHPEGKNGRENLPGIMLSYGRWG